MASVQKRWLTAPKSTLTKANIVKILRRDDAWILLSEETRQHLYSLLPPPREGEPAHDIDVHPLKSQLQPYIESDIRKWQEDLKEGRESRKWREEALKAGRELAEGKWDEWRTKQREETWGKSSTPTANGVIDPCEDAVVSDTVKVDRQPVVEPEKSEPA